MITESTIEKIIQQFENQEIDYEQVTREFAGQQPALLAYLMAEGEGIFTEDESDFMIYLALVIFKSVQKENPGLLRAEPEDINVAEDANWAVLESTQGSNFRNRLDPFFENTPQEDLLAFIEDALTHDAEDEDGDTFRLTAEGREPMFVALKTVVDVLTEE